MIKNTAKLAGLLLFSVGLSFAQDETKEAAKQKVQAKETIENHLREAEKRAKHNIPAKSLESLENHLKEAERIAQQFELNIPKILGEMKRQEQEAVCPHCKKPLKVAEESPEKAGKSKRRTLQARLLGATCNVKYGIGEIEIAVYDKDKDSFVITRMNVVNETLCEKGAYLKPSKLADLALNSVLGGNGAMLHAIEVNSHAIATNITELDALKAGLKDLYNKFNLLKIPDYPKLDARIVALERLDWDEKTVKKVPNLIEKAKQD